MFYMRIFVASVISIAGMAQASIPDPQVAEIHIELKKGGTVVVRGDALVSWKKPLEFNSVRDHQMETTGCEKTPISGPMIYKDGVEFQVGGISRNGTFFASTIGFAFHIPGKGQPSPSNNGCVIKFMNTRTYSSSGANFMKAGETATMRVDDVTFSVTVKAIHDKAPEGRLLDTFVKD